MVTCNVSPSAMSVADPEPSAWADPHGDGEGSETAHDFAWATVHYERAELTGEHGTHCTEHGPFRTMSLGSRRSGPTVFADGRPMWDFSFRDLDAELREHDRRAAPEHPTRCA